MESERPQDEPKQDPFAGLLRVMLFLLNSQSIEAITRLYKLVRRILSAQTHEGMYEVLELESRLELLDVRGEKAVLHKREKVRFLQNHILAYADKAWGDGDIFAGYRCSPGQAVDIYREGHRHNILISLRTTRHRGDTEEFRIERTIKRGFTRAVEDWQTEIDHTTRRMALAVVFPQKRCPKQVMLIEQNAARITLLGGQHQRVLPDGRQQWEWTTRQARLFEAYILRWVW